MTDQHLIKTIEKWLPLARRQPDDRVAIDCHLLPASQVIAFVLVLLAISTLSWVIVPGGNGSGLSVVLQLMIIPIIIWAAARLNLTVSSYGIEAQSRIHSQTLHGRKLREWKDLHTVRLRKFKSPAALLERIADARRDRLESGLWRRRFLRFLGRNWMNQGFLMLDFTSGGMAAFPLAGFSPEALENLFLALSRYADPMVLNPDVIALQHDVLCGQPLQISESYTKMWEQSLGQRFELTNFVPLMGGQTLAGGTIKILMLMACGGLSSVYLARDHKGKRVVVKEMSLPYDSGDEALKKIHEMFDREAALLAKIDHPHIARVYDHFVELGRDYLVLEFVPGLTLRQHVQLYGPFSEADARSIGLQIADLLIYLHGCSPPIVHRDMTPDNLILREPERNITLIDFGAANEFVGKVTGTLIGKQCYIPKEQFQGQAVPQSDLYATGATLHYLLTGCDPEPISVSHPQQVRRDLSDKIDSLVARATAVEPEARLQSAVELKSLLDQLQAFVLLL